MAGDSAALTEQQKRGALLFFGWRSTRGQLRGVSRRRQLHRQRVFTTCWRRKSGPGKGNGYSRREDWGRANVTFDARDRFAFRTPSLRNVTLTAPYFHDGAFATLDAAIRHHADIDGQRDRLRSQRQRHPARSLQQPASVCPRAPACLGRAAAARRPAAARKPIVADLVAFLDALTDPAARDSDRADRRTNVPSGLPLDPLPDPAPRIVSPPVPDARMAYAGPAGRADSAPTVGDEIGAPGRRCRGRSGWIFGTAPSATPSTRTWSRPWAAASAGSTMTATAGSTSTWSTATPRTKSTTGSGPARCRATPCSTTSGERSRMSAAALAPS